MEDTGSIDLRGPTRQIDFFSAFRTMLCDGLPQYNLPFVGPRLTWMDHALLLRRQPQIAWSIAAALQEIPATQDSSPIHDIRAL